MTNTINHGVNGESSQEQSVDQFNYSNQLAAVAISAAGGNARAVQNSIQENANYQKAVLNAENINGICYLGNQVNQNANAEINQNQTTNQEQRICQCAALALAFFEGSQAVARQSNEQDNFNKQNGECSSGNTNNNDLGGSTSTQLEANNNDNKPNDTITVCKDIRSTGGTASLDPFRILVTLKQNGETIGIEADETGKVKMNGIEEAQNNLERLKERAENTNLNSAVDMYININYRDEILEIRSDEQGRIFINGREVEVANC
ncbi:hypothetical protein [Desulfofalx alkaliphila]|uniref:hypothetical protein n=1 Tax=Desulfofalx alkaliphila TaxID=105483 RepID=UPI0004E182E4|nr:hypothetical protein [Desulfofalx alkaliphila]